MQYSHIPLLQTGILPLLISDYLSAKESVKPLYNLAPTLENFQLQLENKKKNFKNRLVLKEVLQKQYKHLAVSDTVKNNIESLSDENTFTVTTAHQTNIFTGPLYYIYKIIHVIKLAEKLQQQYTDKKFVPVYWMGCEDHDIEEINHIHVLGEKLEWHEKQGGATGRHNPNSLLVLIEKLKLQLVNEPYATTIISIFEKAYAENNSLADATQYFLNELFGKYGLVVINPDNRKLKQLFTHVIEAELFNETVVQQTKETINNIENLGYKPQANPRAINLFYLDENIRERIVRNSDDVFEVLNTSIKFSKAAILELIKTNPEKFSPNVFLRPLYQETVLPNLAYVGGSGELSYWLEQKNIFDFFKVPFPILMQRNSFLLVDAATQKKMQKLQLPVTAYFTDEDTLIKNYIAENSSLPNFEKERVALQDLFQQIKAKTILVDITLQATVEAQLQQALNNLDNLEKKIIKAEKNKQEVAINQLKAVRNKLQPNNILQERYENILPYYAKHGEVLFDALYKAIQPLDANMNIVELT
jgi:bacillithiol biosynthesis cysteine-adding enzyme BshC